MAVISDDIWPRLADAIGFDASDVVSCSVHFRAQQLVRVVVEVNASEEGFEAVESVLKEFDLVPSTERVADTNNCDADSLSWLRTIVPWWPA